MKSSGLAIFVSLLIFTGSNLPILAYDPPQSLKWGMSFEEVKNVIKDSPDLEIKEPNKKELPKGYREYKELRFPDDYSYSRAELKGAKLLDKKLKRTFLVFDNANGLSSFQYFLLFDNDETNKGYRKCWVFHSDLKSALETKYGAPTTDETDEDIRQKPIASGVKYSVLWEDSTGSQIELLITRQTHKILGIGGIDEYIIFLIYSVNGYFDLLKENKIETDEF